MSWKPFTTKNSTWPVNQKPRALISTQAWSDILAVFSENVSPLNGCSCGSTQTFFQTSVNKFAVVFRIWLWRKVTNPPLGNWRACCKLNVLPQAQWLGIRFNLRSYLISSVSQNCCLFRTYPSSLIERVVSQEDTAVSRHIILFSFFWAHFIFCNFENLFCRSFFIDFICFFLIFMSESGSCLLNWSVTRLQLCPDIMMEFWYSNSPFSSNVGIPSAPSWGPKGNSFLSFSVIVIPPVMAGINSVRITSSAFLNSLHMPGIVIIVI